MTTADINAQTIDGAALLDRLRAILTRYVVLPSDHATDAVVLWIAATHAQPSWAHAARLVIRAPEKRCGKSRLLDIVEATCWEPLITVNASPPAIYRSIGSDEPPTILLDEADTIFGPAAQGANEDLRGLLNAGHQRNRPTIRYDAAKARVEKIPTFAMAALAGIGHMPDTIEDRAAVIRMRRRAPGETVAPYRERRDGPALRRLAAELHTWVRAHAAELAAAEPDMPVEDRAADTWEPLVAIADLAGGHWPERGRNACVVLTGERDAVSEEPLSVRLLRDCQAVFENVPALPSGVLIQRLCADPEAPWATLGPRGEWMTPMKLGKLLAEYDIRPGTYRFTEGQAKGYRRDDFADAWNRYCPPNREQAESDRGHPEEPYQTYQPHNPTSEAVRLHSVVRLEASSGHRHGSAGHDQAHAPGTAQAVPPHQAVPGLTRQNEAGTAGTATSPHSAPTCIRCRLPLTFDDGTHTHPNCA
ncbi:DUF3631 domain-containing protein [Kineosporia sp. NBRC 101731]|uniref:DUF3631 domain-containing protein n=1 Tax=Kineosporia sp. NBRC 101731 TaxID=3032199 RepID=UPI0024A3EF05|nr:DUF3631 domain-containing protein [Kineosporia sp. NBRC 101731]GLY33551.1 hypothetical protein Kisp02_69160 [Kineosporia sp. NBRC 101731]